MLISESREGLWPDLTSPPPKVSTCPVLCSSGGAIPAHLLILPHAVWRRLRNQTNRAILDKRCPRGCLSTLSQALSLADSSLPLWPGYLAISARTCCQTDMCQWPGVLV